MGHLHRLGGPPRFGLRARAAAASALLSLLFLAVYGTTNWLTTLRPDVSTWHFGWELAVPFVPWMIVPYMSIDLFFVAAPLLCRDERELAGHVRRVVFAVLTAAAFFLLMPLQLGFERPPGEGWLGAGFDLFRSFDAPHNLFPSLHITLLMLLTAVYVRLTRGALRVALLAWFGLIGLSTLLTHQHHLVDVAGGVLLAGFACYLFPDEPPRHGVVRNARVGANYAAGAAIVLVAAVAARPWGAFLLWPAAALGLTAAAYFGPGAALFRKANGRLPLSTRFVLFPVLVGQRLSLTWYRRQCRPWDLVAPGVLIGRQLGDAEAAGAVQEGVTAVLDLTGEFSEAVPFLAVRYRNLAVLDLTAPTREQLVEAAAFIRAESERGTVYVHCKIGYSRSAAAVAAFLLAAGRAATVDEALAQIRSARPPIVIRNEVVVALYQFQA